MPNKIDVIFFGSDVFGMDILKGLIDNSYFNVVGLVTRSPKPSGRGLKPTPNPLLTLARKHEVPILFSENADDWDKIISTIKNKKPEYAVVANFGKIIPQKILDLLPDSFINVHPSLLPKYRGPSPIETAILNGDKETGVSFIILTEKMDAGPVLRQYKIKIGNVSSPELEKKMGSVASRNICQVISDYKKNKISAHAQSESQATYTQILTKGDGLINDNDSSLNINRKFNALFGWPGIYFIASNKIFKIIDGSKKMKYFYINKIQPESKKVLSNHEFINGYKDVLTNMPKFVKIIGNAERQK